ncbi:MAG: tetratricopeptide repeat protein [Planctomycetota bacterium]|jgi:tetratricopeptide (TPR) repeat protein
MSDDNNDNKGASFLGGQSAPDENEKEETIDDQEESSNEDSSGGGAGFLGGMSSSETEDDDSPDEDSAASADSSDGEDASGLGFLGGAVEVQDESSESKNDDQVESEGLGQNMFGSGGSNDAEEEQGVDNSDAVTETPQPLPDSSASAAEFFSRGEELSEEGHYNSAITAYRKGLDKQPDNPVAINNLAMIYIELDRLNEARTELEQAVTNNIDYPEIYSNLGYVLRKQGNDVQAAEAYQKYLDSGVEADESEKIKAWIESVTNTSEEAPPASGQEQQPSGSEGADLLAKAASLYDREDFSEAISAYNKVLTIDPNSSEALMGRGKAEIKAGLLQEAVVSLRESVATGQSGSEIYYILGFALRSLEKNSDAAEAYEQFLALDPSAENAGKIRSWIDSVKSEEPASTVSADDSATEEDHAPKVEKQPAWASAMEQPEYDTSYLDPVGAEEEEEVSETSDALAESEGVSDQPSEESPSVPEITVEDAENALAGGDIDRAVSAAQAIIKSNPESIDARILIARCFGKKGEFAKAMPILKIIINKAPDRLDAWFLLGRCQQELGKDDEAKDSFNQIIEIDSESEIAERAKEVLADLGSRHEDNAVCANCMESVSSASLSDVEGRMICVDCRDKMDKSMGGAMRVDDEMVQVRKSKFDATETKRMQRQKASKRSLVKVFLILIPILGLLGLGGVIALKQLQPQTYKRFFGDSNIQSGPVGQSGVDDPFAIKQTDVAKVDEKEEKEVIPPSPAETVKFTSVPLTQVMEGFTYKYRIECSDPEALSEVQFSVSWVSEKPKGEYLMLPERGSFTFKPVAEDAGRVFKARFSVKWPDIHESKPDSIHQEVDIRINNLPEIKPLEFTGQVDFSPEVENKLIGADLNGDKVDELIYCSGEMWSGKATVFNINSSGRCSIISSVKLAGRPVSVDAFDIDGKNGYELAIADWWNKTIIIYGFNENLDVMQVLKLDENPRFIRFSTFKGRKFLVVYFSSGAIQLYNISGNGKLVHDRTIQALHLGPWKSMEVLDFVSGSINEGPELVFAALGKKQPNIHAVTIYKDDAKWSSYSLGRGIISASSVGRFAMKRSGIVFAVGGKRPSLANLINKGKINPVAGKPLGLSDNVISLACADIDGSGGGDVFIITRNGVYVQLAEADESLSDHIVKLKSSVNQTVPYSLSCSGYFKQKDKASIIFVDRSGSFYEISSGRSASKAGGK